MTGSSPKAIPEGRAALVTLAAVVGVLVGLRSVMALSVAGPGVLLRPEGIPVETLGIEWSDLALWPADAQQAGLERLARALASLALAVAAVATLNVVMLLAEGSAARRAEVAVRSALGASPRTLFRMLAREVRTLLLGGATLGTTAGVLAGVALRLTWPGGLEAALPAPPVDALAVVALLLAAVVFAHAGGALGGVRTGRSAGLLRAGARATADPAAVFTRRALGALHVAVAATVLVNAWGLVAPASGGPAAAEAPDDVWVARASVDDPGAWTTALAAVADVPGLEAESLAAPGALVGLGVRDLTITECGNCSIGGLPAPLWNATSEHHAVGPGFFEMVGVPVVEGRALAPEDGDGAPLVAVVSRRLADVAFEDGDAIGRRLRIGNDFERWYTVVGIVDDFDRPVLGEDARPRGSVYLSAAQRPPTRGRILLRGSPEAVSTAHAALADAGVAAEPAVRLADFLRRESAPLRWAGRLMRVLAALALAVGLHGIWLTALQTTRRRAPELAVRRALGASRAATIRLVLGGRLRTTGWGLAGFVLLGTAASAPFQRAAGVDGAGPGHFVAVGVLLLAVSLLASARAVGEALSVAPRRLLD